MTAAPFSPEGRSDLRSFVSNDAVERIRALPTSLRELSQSGRARRLSVQFRYRDQEFAWRDTEGALTRSRETYDVGCVVHLLIAVLAHQLHANGAIDLDDLVDDVLAELQGSACTAKVTLRHLLSRSSGLQDPRSPQEAAGGLAWPVLADRLRRSPRLFSPGSVFSYAGVDLSILLEAIQRGMMADILDIADEWVFRPVGIARATLVGADPERFGLTLTELMTIATALAGCGADSQFTSAVAPLGRLCHDLTAGSRPSPGAHAITSFGEGAFAYSDGLLGSDGQARGETCGLRFEPQAGVALAVALEGTPDVRDAVIALALDALGFGGAPCGSGDLGTLDCVDREEACGRYVGWARHHAAEVTPSGPGLRIVTRFMDRPVRNMEFTLEGLRLRAPAVRGLSTVRFFRDGAGSIVMALGTLPYLKV